MKKNSRNIYEELYLSFQIKIGPETTTEQAEQLARQIGFIYNTFGLMIKDMTKLLSLRYPAKQKVSSIKSTMSKNANNTSLICLNKPVQSYYPQNMTLHQIQQIQSQQSKHNSQQNIKNKIKLHNKINVNKTGFHSERKLSINPNANKINKQKNYYPFLQESVPRISVYQCHKNVNNLDIQQIGSCELKIKEIQNDKQKMIEQSMQIQIESEQNYYQNIQIENLNKQMQQRICLGNNDKQNQKQILNQSKGDYKLNQNNIDIQNQNVQKGQEIKKSEEGNVESNGQHNNKLQLANLNKQTNQIRENRKENQKNNSKKQKPKQEIIEIQDD